METREYQQEIRRRLLSAEWGNTAGSVVDMLNDIDTGLLDADRGLLFQLRLVQLVAMVRAGPPRFQVCNIISYAQNDVSPLVWCGDPRREHERLAMLEDAMLLLGCHSNEGAVVGEAAYLLESDFRVQIVDRIDAAIRRSMNQVQNSCTVVDMETDAENRKVVSEK